ncbi:MAG: hypothetical protein FWB90_06980 [Fibromonadales bacterium]|nr:hypothetical protein [Fibromonadales bacterium]
MYKKTFILFAAALFALLFSCSDDVVKAENVLQTELHVTAQDASTGEFVEAKAVLLGDALVVPVAGSATFKVMAGTHRILVEKPGYASIEIIATIDTDEHSNVYVAKENYINAQLYPLTAGLSGYLTYTNANGKDVPAAGATVRITFPGLLLKNFEEATTDTDGKYVFANLPAVVNNYKIAVLPVIMADGKSFGELELNSTHALESGFSIYNDVQNISVLTSTFVVSYYTKNVFDADTVAFAFSDDINLESVTNSTVDVSPVIAINIKWGKNTLAIVPAGKWTGNFYVELNNLKSVKGQSLSNNNYLITVLKPDLSSLNVTGLVNTDSASINFDSESAALRWNRLEGAEKYEIYATKNGLNKFEKVGETSSLLDTSALVHFNAAGDVNIGTDAYIFNVQGVNSNSKSLLKGNGLLVYVRQ